MIANDFAPEDDAYLFLRAELFASWGEVMALPVPLRRKYRERLKRDLEDEKRRAESGG